MSYHDSLPRQYTVPVICRIKRIFWDRGQKFYELEPIVLPEKNNEKTTSDAGMAASREKSEA